VNFSEPSSKKLRFSSLGLLAKEISTKIHALKQAWLWILCVNYLGSEKFKIFLIVVYSRSYFKLYSSEFCKNLSIRESSQQQHFAIRLCSSGIHANGTEQKQNQLFSAAAL